MPMRTEVLKGGLKGVLPMPRRTEVLKGELKASFTYANED
jgi:hypothetical protein